MTLSKQFMAWAIGLSKGSVPPQNAAILRRQPQQANSSSQRHPLSMGHRPTTMPASLRALSTKLLLSYLGAMVAVLGLSAIAVYQYFAYNLLQEVDQQMTTIAAAAKHNFVALQHDRNAAEQRLPKQIDQDGDLDLPWQDLRTASQTVEWFDAAGTRLASVGQSIPEQPLQHQRQPLQQNGHRTLTLPIVAEPSDVLQGYVRVTLDTQAVEGHLERLGVGLGVGGAIALLAIGGTGWWLTRRSLQPVEQTMATLQQFTADASHELRSPLTAIKTAIEVMQSHPERVHPADRRKVLIIGQATQQMSALVEALLVLARMDGAAVPQTGASVMIPLHEVLEDLLEWLQPQAIAAGVQLQVETLEESWVKGDAAQLRRVFLNLCDNALHYTLPGGSICVALRQKELTALSGVRKVAIVTVQDTGIGIATEHLPYLFERFWRVETSRTRQAGGMGLGLAIVQAIIAAHHGTVTVTSQLHQGSCFRVELPSVR
jgi:signal transduction histidine kinase